MEVENGFVLMPGYGGLDARSGGLKEVRHLANAVATKKKAPREVVVQTIFNICKIRVCTLDELADLLQRSTTVIRKDYIQPMLKARLLQYKFPTKPNHPEQAYLSNLEGNEK